MRMLLALALVATTIVGCKTTNSQTAPRRSNDNWSSDGVPQRPASRSQAVRNAFNNFQY